MAYSATSLFKFASPYPSAGFAPFYVRYQLFLNVVMLLCLVLTGAYRDLRRAPLGHQAVTSFKACVWAGAIALATLFLCREQNFSSQFITVHLAQQAVLSTFLRIMIGRMENRDR